MCIDWQEYFCDYIEIHESFVTNQQVTGNPKMSDATTGERPSSAVEMERFSYDDAIVRKFAIATFIWGLVATLVGLFIALEMAFPQANLGIPWLTFGQIGRASCRERV